MTISSVIYCPPCDEERGILKIDMNTNNVTELDRNLLPEYQGDDDESNWTSCTANHIMKLDPSNNDAMSSVRDDLGDEWFKYIGTVVGIDRCVYGIPTSCTKCIIKYDPINDITSYVGEKVDKVLNCSGNGVWGRDGCIYAFAGY